MSRKSKITLEKPHLTTYLDLGIMDFMRWLSALENDNPIEVKEIVKDKYIIFYDKELLKDVIVVFKDCVPWCINCEEDDCGHIGFAICLKQYYVRNGSVDV